MPRTNREEIITELEQWEQIRRDTMGGVDPVGCVAACNEIVGLRNLLRDDDAMFAHLGRVVQMTAKRPHNRLRVP